MLKDDIISLLRKKSQGLMARKIARELGVDKSAINSVLYGNQDVFSVDNYVWKLNQNVTTENPVKSSAVNEATHSYGCYIKEAKETVIARSRNLRAYYSASIAEFLRQSNSEIIGIIHSNDISAETTIQQSNTWESEVQILKDQLRSFSDGRIIF